MEWSVGGTWDNWNSIINKYIKKEKEKKWCLDSQITTCKGIKTNPYTTHENQLKMNHTYLHLYKIVQYRQIHRDRKQISGCRGLWEEEWRVTTNEHRVSYWIDINILAVKKKKDTPSSGCNVVMTIYLALGLF